MAKRKKISLKAALSSQKLRLKKKQQAQQATQAAEKKQRTKAAPSARGKERNTKPSSSYGKNLPARSTIPFLPTNSILLIGEGNFSFARALVMHPPTPLLHLPARNVTATAYDSEEACYSKYPDAADCVRTLRGAGAEVLFGVDATRLERCTVLRKRCFDRVMWNFPHAGVSYCASMIFEADYRVPRKGHR